MCLILFAHRITPGFPLVLIANRDEFYSRPTLPLGFWPDHPSIVAGRDLEAGGTWLGMNTQGAFAALTNYRDPASLKQNAPSRGDIITDYLTSNIGPESFLERLIPGAGGYNGFNLILGDTEALYWYSNKARTFEKLPPGIHGLSNRFLNTPWPKVTKAKKDLEKTLGHSARPDPEALFQVLLDRDIPDDALLPETGVGLEWERILSPVFITSPTYGTRSSTVLIREESGAVKLIERTHNPMEAISHEQIEFSL